MHNPAPVLENTHKLLWDFVSDPNTEEWVGGLNAVIGGKDAFLQAVLCGSCREEISV